MLQEAVPGSEQRDKDKSSSINRDKSSYRPGELGEAAPGKDRSGEPGTPSACGRQYGKAGSDP